MALFRKKDPFDPTGLEGLSALEQEKVLTRVASREFELLEGPKTKKTISGEAEQRIKTLEKQKGFSRTRQAFIDAAQRRREQKKRSAQTPIAGRLRGLASTTVQRGLSPLQRNILKRDRLLKVIKQTPPMDRARLLNRSSQFQQARDAVKGVNSVARTGGGLTRFQDSKVQQKLAEQRAKTMAATQGQKIIGEKTGLILGGSSSNVLPSRLKGPTRLL